MKRETFVKTLICAWFVGFVLCLGASAARAQTTAFTYQGRLTDGAGAASGSYDLGFALYDAETGGTQIGTTLTRPNVTVSGGIFTVQLDFGASAFAANASRFLEIAVKKTTETNFTTLAPLQPLTSSPYAIRTINSNFSDALSSSCASCVTNAQINSVDGAKITGSVANAATAQNAGQLGGVAASNYVQSDSNAFVRNQTGAQTADFNVTGTGSIGGNVGIGTAATATEALRVAGGNGGDFGGTGKGISLQSGSGGEGFSGFGGNAGAIRIIGGTGGRSSVAGGAGGEIRLQGGDGGFPSRSGAEITLQGGYGGDGNSTNNGGAGAGVNIIGGNGGTAISSRSGGNGASITLQPGSGGIAERPENNGASGNVILAPTNGNVGIGTNNPTSKLFVNGDLTVTGTLNGTATNATSAANAANADKLDNLDSTQFARTADTANFIRNQTAAQTGNFNISGNGAVGGNLTVGGTLNAALGQDATTVNATASLSLDRFTGTTYTPVPGLTKTITVPANTFLVLVYSTDGEIQTNSTTSDGRSVIQVGIFVDNANINAKVYQLSNATGFFQASVNWALSGSLLLAPGSHTIEVRARSNSATFLSPATLNPGAGGTTQLTVMLIKR